MSDKYELEISIKADKKLIEDTSKHLEGLDKEYFTKYELPVIKEKYNNKIFYNTDTVDEDIYYKVESVGDTGVIHATKIIYENEPTQSIPRLQITECVYSAREAYYNPLASGSYKEESPTAFNNMLDKIIKDITAFKNKN